MSIVIFGRIRIRREEPARSSTAERCMSDIRALCEQRFNRLGELLLDLR
jgi:hypothetical protein